MPFKPSAYQEKVFDFVQNGTGNGIINAVAGSGKTTTLVEAMKLMPKDAKALFVAFNKNIADELRARAGDKVETKTLNAFGWSICMRCSGRKFIKLDSNKTTYILRFQVLNVQKGNKEQEKYYYSIQAQIKQVVALLKNNMITNPTSNDIDELIYKYGIDINRIENMEMFYQHTLATFKIAVNDMNHMDFDDQLFMPVYHGWSIPKYDFVFVDESQDLNPIQIELVMRASGNAK